MACHNCKSPYHKVDRCPKPPQRSVGKCFSCGKEGHRKADCPGLRAGREAKVPAEGKMNSAPSDGKGCFNCGGPHFKSECPKLVQVEPQQPLMPPPAKEKDCAICMDKETGSFAFSPCGHTQVCSDCVGKFRPGQDPCPICRNEIKTVLKIWL